MNSSGFGRHAARSASFAIVGLLAGCADSSAPSDPEPSTRSCTVGFVADGDTLRCSDGRWIRLLLVDAPEMEQTPYGGQARAWLERTAPPGTRVRMESDLERFDAFGRELAYLYLEGDVMVNESMALDGYVVPLVIPPNGRHEQTIQDAVANAMAAGRGLWGTWGFACLPVDFRAGRCT